ncbi:AAA family ATPase [Microbaculum marinisediminis]|uniref:Helicase RepA family protein n=1 Tax=Microbaculum marinisediminis TaxID=2931392 RepID=A0AAW5R8U1_9HYPH|nr:helicase RepA family protein [Microbaculum sp. A6E488]MCT8974941.1 helicase RepA family protein [Microbaculum sp. A6E488]
MLPDHMTNAELDRLAAGRPAVPSRIHLIPFDKIEMGRERRYLVKGLVPRVGLTVVWGPPKSGKSFWTFDMVMHVALGWEYRSRRVTQGPVVYCAFEGQTGIEARVEAFRQRFLPEDHDPVPFYLEPATLDLVGDHKELVAAVKRQLADAPPVAVVLDTLNRSLRGSESSDQDMTAYIRAADAIRDAFQCAVIVVHHCGIDGTRPRGHTSLTGAVDAQLAVKRDGADNVIVECELAKDGPQGDRIVSRLDIVEVGTDEDGDVITSCVVVETDAATMPTGPREPKLSANQKTMLGILYAAGAAGLSVEEWNDRARDAGIGVKRRADLVDIRLALQSKGLVLEGQQGWFANRQTTDD